MKIEEIFNIVINRKTRFKRTFIILFNLSIISTILFFLLHNEKLIVKCEDIHKQNIFLSEKLDQLKRDHAKKTLTIQKSLEEINIKTDSIKSINDSIKIELSKIQKDFKECQEQVKDYKDKLEPPDEIPDKTLDKKLLDWLDSSKDNDS